MCTSDRQGSPGTNGCTEAGRAEIQASAVCLKALRHLKMLCIHTARAWWHLHSTGMTLFGYLKVQFHVRSSFKIQVFSAFKKFAPYQFTITKSLDQYLFLLAKGNLQNFAFMKKGEKQK